MAKLPMAADNVASLAMEKSARRSIHDDPSSPSNSPYIYYHPSTSKPDTYQLWSPNDFVSTRGASSLGEALSQIKNAENKTSSTEIPSPVGGVSSSPKPSSNAVPSQKPPTTTYKSFTTTYKSTSSTRSYINYTKPSDSLTELDRLRLREEFFATYDVMTGIRIAGTLGGFFFLMVFLIVYKSRSKSNKALQDPGIQARAAATVQEEEDRELQEAYEKTAFSLYQDELIDMSPVDLELQRDRLVSLGNVSCPPYVLNPNLRFSSVGGYSSLIEPPRRYSDSGRHRRQSNSDSSRILSAYHLNDNYSNQNENFFNESEGEEGDDEFDQRFTTTAEISYPHGLLNVPRGADSRRSSGMTCCSTESSFLERRCSAITLGLSSYSRGSSRRPSRVDMWEVDAHHPGIHIIEATPKTSPCPSERATHYAGNGGLKDHIKMRFKRKQRHDDNSIDSITEYPDENNHQYRSDNTELSENVVVNSNSNTPQCKTLVSSDNISHQPVIRRAPLASLSSFKMSSIECQDSDANGSVFDESCNDTDDDMEQFSTDSDEISLQSPPLTDQHLPKHTQKELNGRNESSLDKNCDASVVIVTIDKNDDDELNNVNNSINVFSSVELVKSCETIERQNDKISPRPASYSGCISSSASDKKSNSSECVTINVVEFRKKNNEESSLKPSAPPSSVILEMPILAKQNETSPNEVVTVDPDPSIAETSRKWSRETLF